MIRYYLCPLRFVADLGGSFTPKVNAYPHKRWECVAPTHDPAPYPSPDQMVYDLRYATAMARVHYLRVPAALPEADDLEAQAAYWKRHYNTPAGKGTVEQYIKSWHAYT